ncbi:carboxylate-amine ligase [Candidatus Laterigemmans baculatus]|uniref:carboxylate-amine ligase n=1 Tax=Candidatus Laterigemmans baculatus TaxID=2770505 RepID=UPI0013DC064B|nr:YbdK family carboxylate-amine ligase [Candidatus Laterigemmans baculatus]
MTKLEFTANARPTVGIEIELGLLDNQTFALASECDSLIAHLETEPLGCVKPELMQSCVELNSDVSQTIADARGDLEAKLRVVQHAADQLGLRLWWGATHPFSHWKDQVVTATPRYQGLVDLLQEMARRLITFGLHVHVGVDSGDKAVMICDRIMQHLPTLLALTCSSPFWESRDTGLQSQRSKIMEGLPTAGLPPLMRNWSEYTWLVNHMVDTGFIHTIREIWWDVRPHHKFGTVEVRMCDMPGNLDDVCAMAALIQCLVQQLSNEIDEGTYQFDCHPMMVRQNKWRASRYGTNAALVNGYNYEVQPVRQIASRLVERLEEIATELRCTSELRHVLEIAAAPTWAERQRELASTLGSSAAMVDRLSSESAVEG